MDVRPKNKLTTFKGRVIYRLLHSNPFIFGFRPDEDHLVMEVFSSLPGMLHLLTDEALTVVNNLYAADGAVVFSVEIEGENDDGDAAGFVVTNEVTGWSAATSRTVEVESLMARCVDEVDKLLGEARVKIQTYCQGGK